MSSAMAPLPIVLACALLLGAGAAQTPVKFVDFEVPSRARVEGVEQELVLRGHAKVDRNMLPWYGLALHGDYRVRRREAWGEALEPCRITLVWLENEAGEAVVREHFAQLFARTVPAAAYTQMAPQIEEFLNSLPGAKRGQVWRFDYWPDGGMQILIDDQPLRRVSGFDLNQAVLGLWLGKTADSFVLAQLTERMP